MSKCDHSKVCTENCEHRGPHETSDESGKVQCAEKRCCHVVIAFVRCVK